MEHCTVCGLELPEDARFCGQCGQLATTGIEMATLGNVMSADAPTALSNQSHPTYSDDEEQQKLLGATLWHNWSQKGQQVPDPETPSPEGPTVWHHWSQEEKDQISTPMDEEKEDEEERRRGAAMLGLPLLGALANEVQVPHVPLIKGTPQVRGVARVQGTPPSALASGTPRTPGTFSKSDIYSSPTDALHHSPSHDLPHHHPHPSHPRPTGCLVIAFTVLVIVAGFISALFFVFPPGLSLSGSGMVAPGGTLLVHGGGFLPGSSVTLTLDGGVPLLVVAPHTSTVARYDGALAVGSGFIAPTGAQVALSNVIKANNDGTFNVTITANQSLAVGSHTIRATENTRSLSAQIRFEVVLLPGKLQVGPASLDFGMLKAGSKATQAVTISNVGQQPFNWTADTGNASWLSLDKSTQTLQPGAQQTIQVTADSTKLAVGVYSAVIHITSNAGSSLVPVKLQVTTLPVAQLDVKPLNLDFGQLTAGKAATKTVTIGNLGTADLNWTADTGNTGWLKLDTASGKVQVGGSPQTLNVTVDTTGLTAGTYSATIQINSDGGKKAVTVSLVVTALPVAQLDVKPLNLDFGQLTAGKAATKTVTIGNLGTADLNWTADTGNTGWLNLDTTSGKVQVGASPQTINVTVDTTGLTAGTYSATIQINSDGGKKAVTVSLVVNPPSVPPAQLNVSPSSLNFSFTDVAATDSQPITIANTGGSPLNWTATLNGLSSNNVAVSLSSSSGTNLAGGASGTIHVIVKAAGVARTETITANVTVSATDAASGNPVAGSSQTVSITITITAPPPPPPTTPPPPLSLVVAPTSLGATSRVCTSDPANGSWACTVTLAEDANGQGNLDWSVATDLQGATFSQLSGTLSPGQPVQVTISSIPCSNGSFTFSGGAQPVTVSWSCSPPPPSPIR